MILLKANENCVEMKEINVAKFFELSDTFTLQSNNFYPQKRLHQSPRMKTKHKKTFSIPLTFKTVQWNFYFNHFSIKVLIKWYKN